MTGTTAPRISLLTPVYDPPLDALRATVESVTSQDFESWELILVDDRSPDPEVAGLLRQLASTDPRILVVERERNGGIVAASNTALEHARGEFVALLDHDDLLADGALRSVSAALADDVDYLYTDEDKVAADGTFYDEFAKPVWSPERLRNQMYTGHLSVLRADLVREVGGFAEGTDGSQDHDLVLRVTERARRIVHLPGVHYHWRAIAGSTAQDPDAKPYAWTAGQAAVQRHLDRVGIHGTAELGPVPGTYHVRRRLDPATKVSIVIPTRGSTALVWGETRCLVVELVRSLVLRSTHANMEIVVVYDEPTPEAVLAEIRQLTGERGVLVPFLEPFNFSAKCNVGYLASTGDVVMFVNDDTELVSPDLVEQLGALLLDEGVGASGARLLFADGSLQHGGHVYVRGDITHAGFKAPRGADGPFSAFHVSREVSGLTAACVAVTRTTFEEVGGFCEELPGSFNDVDFSHKIAAAGHRLVWAANATMYHFESLTRDSTVLQWEYDMVLHRWGTPDVDPYFPAGYRVD